MSAVRTEDVKARKAQATRKALAVRSVRRAGSSAALPRTVHDEYGLSHSLFARLLGVPETTLTRWQKTGKLPKRAQSKMRHVTNLLHGLSRIMPKADLARWLTSPNDACRSAGSRRPADLMEKGRYDKIEAMIYFFESGVAY
jgi:DNA-binding transcriptional regulator YiaG